MISLDQVRLLEQKVEGMLALFSRLKSEKSALEKENGELKTELETLKAKCGRFEQDEAKLEQGILSVLNRLNDMEDAVQNVMDSSAVKSVEPEVSVHETGPASDTQGTAAETEDKGQTASAVSEPQTGAQLDIF
ncbi:cell division protein ZapB [Treponema sp.]|uniref:cell division protein ZapB n=1 Tax=Treponema sp. TaxID=166 RepID=UPI003FA2C3D3